MGCGKKILIIKSEENEKEGAEEVLLKIKGGLEKTFSVDVLSLEGLLVFIDSGHVSFYSNGEEINFRDYCRVYFRNIKRFSNIAFMVSVILEREGIPFVDGYLRQGGDTSKACQIFSLSLEGVPVPKTAFSSAYDSEKAMIVGKKLSYPVVAKIVGLSGGRGVSLLKDYSALLDFIREEGDFSFQEFIENDFDYRILVLGGKARVVERRTRVGDDFRNNVSLGGKEDFLDIESVPKEMLRIAERAAGVLDIQVAGVDILENGGEYFVIEVNSAPQFTLGEESPEVKEIVDFLKRGF